MSHSCHLLIRMTAAVQIALRVLSAAGASKSKSNSINIDNTPNFVTECYDAPCRDGQHNQAQMLSPDFI